jgi:hypothetical protein
MDIKITEEKFTENKIIISNAAKKKFLEKLIGKVIKILHLVEEREETKIDPRDFIYGQLVELNSANQLFDNELVEIIVKLNVVYRDFDRVEFKAIKKQIFEIKRKINYLIQLLDEKERANVKDNK